VPATCHSQRSRPPAQSPGRRRASRVSGRRDADEALVPTAPTARRPDVLVPMICAHVLARSAYSQVREIGRSGRARPTAIRPARNSLYGPPPPWPAYRRDQWDRLQEAEGKAPRHHFRTCRLPRARPAGPAPLAPLPIAAAFAHADLTGGARCLRQVTRKPKRTLTCRNPAAHFGRTAFGRVTFPPQPVP
jgi:hypothetical protein